MLLTAASFCIQIRSWRTGEQEVYGSWGKNMGREVGFPGWQEAGKIGKNVFIKMHNIFQYKSIQRPIQEPRLKDMENGKPTHWQELDI